MKDNELFHLDCDIEKDANKLNKGIKALFFPKTNKKRLFFSCCCRYISTILRLVGLQYSKIKCDNTILTLCIPKYYSNKIKFCKLVVRQWQVWTQSHKSLIPHQRDIYLLNFDYYCTISQGILTLTFLRFLISKTIVNS